MFIYVSDFINNSKFNISCSYIWHYHLVSFEICSHLIVDQDSVRLLSVEGCVSLGKLLEPKDCVAQILPTIVKFSQV